MTANPQKEKEYVERVEVHTVYSVVYTDIGGVQGVKEFASVDDRDNFAEGIGAAWGAMGIQVADLMPAGHM